MHVRLVKGAYVEPAEVALPYGEPTDLAFLRYAHWLAEHDVPFALATHDGVLREALLLALGPRPVEHLLGVRPDVLADLVAGGPGPRVRAVRRRLVPLLDAPRRRVTGSVRGGQRRDHSSASRR